MKIIISHDVDHIYSKDHIFRDMIFPKLWVRSFIHFLQGKISFKTLWFRWTSIFEKNLNRINAVMEKDKQYGVPSVFFFGMRQGIGMSYKKEEAYDVIKNVEGNGFDVGVHGVAYEQYNQIEEEYADFKNIVQKSDFGIRTHYVRFDESTFDKMSRVGYLFDSSEFNKHELEIKAPYKVNDMWEFPLHIMDGYIIPPGNLEKAMNDTIHAIEKARKMSMPYCTILYHDYQYNEKTYPVEKAWYDWLLDYLKKEGYEFISYREAIKELNKQYDTRENC